MKPITVQEIDESKNPLAGAEEFIFNILEKGGYEPKGDTSVYRKSGSPAEFVFVPLGLDEARFVWDKCFIEKPISTENAIYVTASLESANLLGQIRYLEGTKTGNSMIPGMAIDQRYLRVQIDDDDCLQLPVTLTDDVYIGLGLVDENRYILPCRYFRDAETLESLLEHPRLIALMDTVCSAQETYTELLSVMRGIAEKRNDMYYDGSQDIRMQGAITTPLRDGRQIVTRLSTLKCSENIRNTLEIDGNVYLSVGVRTPYSGGFGLIPLEEIPVFIQKTTKETLSEDVTKLINQLKSDYESPPFVKDTKRPSQLFPTSASQDSIAPYIQ